MKSGPWQRTRKQLMGECFLPWSSFVLHHNKLLNSVFFSFFFLPFPLSCESRRTTRGVTVTRERRRQHDVTTGLNLQPGSTPFCNNVPLRVLELNDRVLPPPDAQEVKARSNRGEEVSQFSLGRERRAWQRSGAL